jgi:membrane protein YdbS with pleckstrin-like domain
MRIPVLGIEIDERFLEHRRRSTSIASIVGGFVAIGLFLYRYYVDGVWSWDLFAVGATIAVVKLSLLTWYLSTK